MAKEKQVSAFDKLIMETIANERTVGKEDDPAKQAMPTLWDYLTRTDCGKDHVMKPGRLTLSLCPAGVSVTLFLGDLGYSMSIVVPYLNDVLSTLESVLSGPNPPFQQISRGDPKVRKRKPKP